MILSRELEQKILSTPGITVTTYAPAAPPPEDPKSLAASEKEFQAQVIKYARNHGFDKIYHTYDSRKSEKGFLDLLMIRDSYLVVAELKVEPRIMTPEQQEWFDAWQAVKPSGGVHVWYPRNWDSIIRVLS